MSELAYELNGERIPRARFYAIACDPRRSVAVEACAGAGKTWMLVSRILRALLEGAEPHEILAITFTKKAAGEMRQRLHEWLKRFSAASPGELARELEMRGVSGDAIALAVERLAGLYARLLESGRPVQVRTFHSWFAALLRSAPLAVLEQLGLPANYELLEDDKEAVQAVWRPFFARVAAQPQARRDFEDSVAAHGRSQTQKALASALSRRVEFALADARGVVDVSVKAFGAQFAGFAGLDTPDGMLGANGNHLKDAAVALGAGAPSFAARGVQLERAMADGDMDSALDALLTRTGEPRKFSEKIPGIAQVRVAQDLALRVLAAREQHAAWLHQRRMARLTRLLIGVFGDLKRERGWVDMNDVERAALVMLSDEVLSGWVQERLDARVRQLLIDEFQDTNPLQWQALHAWLSGYAGAGGQAPAVFVVGDPKQSIYRFRRAEPQVFRAAQEFVVEGLGGDLLSCDHTHRNARRVMAVVNEAMAAAQQADEYDGFRTHTTESREEGEALFLPQIPRSAAPGDVVADEEGEALMWRDSLTEPRETPEETLRTLECRQAAQWVAAQLRAGTPPGQVMVLARKRDRLSVMQDELRRLHIPSQQPEKNDLADAPEVQDVIALLDALVSPAHDLSLARALRSPLFGVGDDDLVCLAQLRRRAGADEREGAPSWFSLLQASIDLTPVLQPIGEKLARWRGWVSKWPPHDALDAIYHDADLYARFAAAAPAALRAGVLANLRALLGAALQMDGARYLTPYAFVHAIKAGGVRAPMAADAGTVRLLTIHGAKGLEAGAVLMLDTDTPPPKAETMGVLVDWPGEHEAPLRFAFLASETHPPACTVDAMAAEQAARRREELNALYVAMTRARSRLVLSSIEPHQAAAVPSWWQRLQPLCDALPAADAAPGGEATAPAADAAFTLRVLPEVAMPAAAPAAPGDAPAEDSVWSRIGSAMHRLLEWSAGGAFSDAQVLAAAREFKLAPAQGRDAAALARGVLAGEGAWAWDPAAVDWQGNEVSLVHEGRVLRLDRLVRRRDDGHWWVLDHKSAAQPQRKPELVAQLQDYRAAVLAAHPGATVKAAFMTAQGKLVMVE